MMDERKQTEKSEALQESLPENAAAAEKKEDKSSSKLEIYDWVQCILAALVAGVLIFLFVGRIIGVDGSSMVPTLHNGDKVVVSRLFYTPKNGDIVVLQTGTFGGDPLVKRVIAVGGQTVNIDFEQGLVYVDGNLLEEAYTNAPTRDREDFRGEITVPDGCVFVMGDNRNASTDSRSDRVGMVDNRRILGKVYWILIPGAENGEGPDWSRIGSVYR